MKKNILILILFIHLIYSQIISPPWCPNAFAEQQKPAFTLCETPKVAVDRTIKSSW
jgi:hypothetical protein